MAKIIDKITLDLTRDVVLGWEMCKPALTVASYADKNLIGSVPPAVEAVRGPRGYELVYGYNNSSDRSDYDYGGHHRTIAGIITAGSLDCFLFDEHRMKPTFEFRPISESRLDGYHNLEVIKFLNRAPPEVASKFVSMFKADALDRFFLRVACSVVGGVRAGELIRCIQN
ncbi:MAG: hypothetical protein QF381_02925 [Nitrososphaerales archaeon]|nr:hypothetical protein [Nitrososphaerales archaeon]